MDKKIREYLKNVEKEVIPQISINCVILGFQEKKLKVIVNPRSAWKVHDRRTSGGFIKQTEDLTDAVERIVAEGTGLRKILFKQFAVFGDASRSFGTEFSELAEQIEDKRALKWFSNRFLSICYLALVDFKHDRIKTHTVHGNCRVATY
jgi:hypothetical protein